MQKRLAANTDFCMLIDNKSTKRHNISSVTANQYFALLCDLLIIYNYETFN